MAHTREVVRVKRYITKVLLFGKDDKGKECICSFFNPSCQKGYSGECEEVECVIDRFRGIDECFKNRHRDKPSKDI